MFDTQETDQITLPQQTSGWFIRKAQSEDVFALKDYCEDMAQQTPNNTSLRSYLLPNSIVEYCTMIEHYASHANSCFFICMHDGQIVGLVKLTGNDNPLTAHQVELSINVHPAYQGQRVGSAMMQQAIVWAQTQPGIRRIQLDVLAHNSDAIRFYERLGFGIEGYRRSAYNLRDIPGAPDFDAITMGRIVS